MNAIIIISTLLLGGCCNCIVKTNTKTTKAMYNKPKFGTTKLNVNQSVVGETLETKIERILNNKEPIKDGAPIIFTERKQGVLASTNIRTDRFEIAIDAMDKVDKSYKAKREERAKAAEKKGEGDGGTEPIQGKPEVGK